jgi:dolichyl-phosphate beta-glucosyltransferase
VVETHGDHLLVCSRTSVTIIIPAFNEIQRIGQTIAEISDYFRSRGRTYEIIVSADGDDGTRELVAKMAATDPRLHVIGSAERKGKGHGIRQAVAIARGEIIGFVDADNKTPIEEFDQFEPWLQEGYEIVIGSRALPQSRIERRQPVYRQVGSRAFGVFLHVVIGLREIADTQCGFKFFGRAAALDLFGRQRIDGYMFDIEILVLAQSAGYRIAQVPVRWRDDGDSRLQLVRGNLRNLLDVLRLRLAKGNRLSPRPRKEANPSQVRRGNGGFNDQE